MNINKKDAKSCINFFCETCNYETNRKSSMDKHYSTSKHLKSINVNENVAESCKNITYPHICTICKKTYKEASGLWRHNKKCHSLSNNEDNDKESLKTDNKPTDNELIMLLIKENSEMKNLIMEVIKNGTHNTNSHNKTFNLQFFLNETCKDAMNIMDFVDSIKLQLSDLENVGKLGFVEGISNIITTNLKALDVTQRPIHCSDIKREVLYVKDEDKWEKENEEKKKMRKVIKHVAHKNSRLISQFKDGRPWR